MQQPPKELVGRDANPRSWQWENETTYPGGGFSFGEDPLLRLRKGHKSPLATRTFMHDGVTSEGTQNIKMKVCAETA